MSLYSYSYNVLIKGKVQNDADTTISLLKYSDMITYVDEEIALTRVDKYGSFEISLNIDKPIVAFLEFKKVKGKIYLEPNATYNVLFPEYDRSTMNQNTNFYLKNEMVLLSIKEDDKHILNSLIFKFDSIYNSYIQKNFNNIYRQRSKALVDSLRYKIKKNINDTTNDFFNNYVKYKIAMIEMPAQIKSKRKMAQEYFFDKAILYDNDAYMQFFNEFYDKYWEISNDTKEIFDCLNMSDCSVNNILKFMHDTLLLKDDRIKEFVLIKELSDYSQGNINHKNNILRYLNDLQNQTKIKEHKKIINTIINNLSFLLEGTKAPDIQFYDINNKLIKLSDFSGKYVYIDFIKSSFIPCLTELKLIEKLYNKYKSQIVFITIDNEKSPSLITNLVKKYKWKWIFANCYNCNKIINDYKIMTYPTYVLIDRDGNIVQYPAEAPTGYIENIFYNISKNNRKIFQR
jgi:thiol-disulfide isomerase/thioredoxin